MNINKINPLNKVLCIYLNRLTNSIIYSYISNICINIWGNTKTKISMLPKQSNNPFTPKINYKTCKTF